MFRSRKLNRELLSVIWLDKMAGATQENREIQDKLRSIVNHLQTFDNTKECEHYIKNVTDSKDKIILIVSGSFGQEITNSIHDLRQIISIFVYCFDIEKNEMWAKNYKKVRGVFKDCKSLYKAINSDTKTDEYQLNESVDLLETEDKIIPFLLHLEFTQTDKINLIKMCKEEYQSNLIALENLRDFEHLYSPANCLDWFFDQTFLFRLLIKALHVTNIEVLYLLRFFLQDIHERLKTCSNIEENIVYRGQLMTTEQLDILNQSIGKEFLRFNTFLLVQKSRDDVLKSLQNATNTMNLNRILFEIDGSCFGKQYKQFIVFPLNIHFRILSIHFDKRIWFVKIVIHKLFEINENKNKNCVEFAHLLRQNLYFDLSESFFKRSLAENPSTAYQCYDGFGRIAQDKELYDEALEFYFKSLKITPKRKQSHCLNNIGCIYDYFEQYEKAVQYYFEAIHLDGNQLNRSMYFNNMGVTYAKNEKYDQAIQCFENSLKIRKELLSDTDPDVGICYLNLGVVWCSLFEHDRAILYYELALKSFTSSNFIVHKAILYQNLGEVYQKQGKFHKALDFYRQSLSLFELFQPNRRSNITYIQEKINEIK